MDTKDAVNKLSRQLKNIGPTLANRLVDAGIETPEKLRALGAQQAFEQMYTHGDAYGDFNAAYLYALEGAIRDCDWLALPKSVKQAHKAYAQGLQARKKQAGL